MLANKTALCPELHVPHGVLRRETRQGLQFQFTLLIRSGLRGGESLDDARVWLLVCVYLGEFRALRVHARGGGFELLESDVEGVDARAVGAGGGIEEEAAVGECGLAVGTGLEKREEVAHEDEVVGMDGLEVGGAVLGVLHPVRKAVHGDEDWGARRTRAGEFSPQGLEDGPGNGLVLDTEAGELCQSHAGLDQRLQSRVFLGDFQAGQDLLIGLERALQQLRSGLILDVEAGVGVAKRRVTSMRVDQFLG